MGVGDSFDAVARFAVSYCLWVLLFGAGASLSSLGVSSFFCWAWGARL